jgi:molybdopterin-guanine dinucleotide biosynthesis protein A
MAMKWGVVVAAGGHAKPELAREMGHGVKGLARFGDRTSLGHLLHAVARAGLAEVVTVGPETVRDEVCHGEWISEGVNAIDNVRLGLLALPAEVDAALLLPADSPLITEEMLLPFIEFIEGHAPSSPWCGAGICPAREFERTFPGVPLRTIGLREGKFVSGGLFAARPDAIHNAITVLTHLRRSRNSQFAMVRRLGLWNLVRYVLGRVRIAEAEHIVGSAFSARALIHAAAHPATCMDFDTVEEYRWLQRWFELHHSIPI